MNVNPIPEQTAVVISPSNVESFDRKFFDFILERSPEGITFIVADDLMIYNRFGKKGISKGIRKLLDTYLFDYKNLVNKRKEIISTENGSDWGNQVVVRSWGDYCTPTFMINFRCCLTLYCHNEHYRKVLDERAVSHIQKMKTDSYGNFDGLVKCSVYYLLEETIWTMNLCSEFGIRNIYYPDDNGDFLKYFYDYAIGEGLANALGIKPHTLNFWNVKSEKGKLEPVLAWQRTVR